MKVLKSVLMYLGVLALMVLHGYLIIRDNGFNFPVAGQFVVLHFIWFDVCERWIKKSIVTPC